MIDDAEVVDCRSEEGVTIGLIDTIINCARLLRTRNLATKQIREALTDLAEDSDVSFLVSDDSRRDASGMIQASHIARNNEHARIAERNYRRGYADNAVFMLTLARSRNTERLEEYVQRVIAWKHQGAANNWGSYENPPSD